MTRLAAVCSLIEPAGVIADVGCDHGIVAEYCADKGLADTVIASDVSDACLEKARKRLFDRTNVSFVACDGIDYVCDEAVIAGMGGILISDIILRAETKPNTLVLCPHRDADRVRRTLNACGYAIDRDMLIEERGRFYFVMRAKRTTEPQRLSEEQYLFGTFQHEICDTLCRYLTVKYNEYAVAPERNADKLEPIIAALRRQGVDPEAM